MEKREFGIDYIRILLTFLVIFHHVAIVYGGSGDWYWKEKTPIIFELVTFNAVNQSFFMGMFFLLAGYFSNHSIENKGLVNFLQDRFIRLGIPLVLYFFILSPLTIALANPAEGVAFFDQVINMAKAKVFEPGPLWFAEALLIFSVVIVLISKYFPTCIFPILSIPNNLSLIFICLGISTINFLVRLVIPVGETFLWLQLGYFPMYILLFYFGYLAYPKRLLSSVTKKMVLAWFPITIVSTIILRVVIESPFGVGKFEGGKNLNALFYAFWEPFVAVGIIFFLLFCFSYYFNKESAAGSFLSRHCYAVFIVHPFFVVLISRLLVEFPIASIIKFILNGSVSILISVLFAWCLLRLPKFSRVL
ncbi:MAG: acyltransferase [Pseudomonadota bacterium]